MLNASQSCRHPRILVTLLCTVLLAPTCAHPQAPNPSAVLSAVDASVARRETDLVSYTAVEHYAIFRDGDSSHPVADMTVQTTYRADSGKSYKILSESGSALLRKEVLERTLQNERDLTKPAARARALIDTANYGMRLASRASVDNRPCNVIEIEPRRRTSHLFKGQIWVDARDGSIVQLKGVTAKPVSILTGPTDVWRHYAIIDGFPMATRATATTSVALVGKIRLVIDYSNYRLQLAPAPPPAQTLR